MLGYLVAAVAGIVAYQYAQGKLKQAAGPAAGTILPPTAPGAQPTVQLTAGAQTPAGSVIAPAQGFSPAAPVSQLITATLSTLRDGFAVGDPTAVGPAQAPVKILSESPVTGPIGLCPNPSVPATEAGAVLAPLSSSQITQQMQARHYNW